ncbi:MAG: zinc metallopeptidase [Opitutales bacterium]|jgi:Zn-dependent membrane protease YugP
MFFEPFLLLIILPALLGFWAQHRIGTAYAKWSRVGSRSRLTGAEVATAIMRSAGIDDVAIVEISGHLTDHYDPVRQRLALSSENYRGLSLAALGVSAHESGHAIQHKIAYPALGLRMNLIPLTNIASSLLPFIMIGGLVFRSFGLLYLGVAAYTLLTVFQLITLPVEFDASRRALQRLQGLGILQPDEMVGAADTLNAAAWTYVAAFIASLGNLAYLLVALSGQRDRN